MKGGDGKEGGGDGIKGGDGKGGEQCMFTN